MILQNSGAMLSCFEDLLFVWEPADLAMSWHLHSIILKTGEKNFSKKSVVAGQKIFYLKEGKTVDFLKGVQVIFGENRTLHICNIINS